MNKQALAFLTLFSLILMLSVYYVTLPNDVTAVISEETQQESTKTDDTSSADEEGSTTMQETIEKNLNEQINAATAVMAASDSSESEKQEALAKIEELKNIQQQQKEIESKLSAKKLDTAVEISDGVCRITIFGSEENKENVNTAMNTAYQIVKDNYLLEVTFKSA